MKELEIQNKRLIKEIEELKEINRVSALAHKVSLIESPLYMDMSKHKMILEGKNKDIKRLKDEVLRLGNLNKTKYLKIKRLEKQLLK